MWTPLNWYRSEEPAMEGWLCPALFRYFDEAPRNLYVKAEVKKSRALFPIEGEWS
jgi:hypothetical protein